jgi:hypothetical protein
MDFAIVLGKVVFPPRRECAVSDSALIFWLANAVDSVNVSGQVGAGRESLRASLALDRSRMGFSVLTIWS